MPKKKQMTLLEFAKDINDVEKYGYETDEEIIIDSCPEDWGLIKAYKVCEQCKQDCYKCWNMPMLEDETEYFI